MVYYTSNPVSFATVNVFSTAHFNGSCDCSDLRNARIRRRTEWIFLLFYL